MSIFSLGRALCAVRIGTPGDGTAGDPILVDSSSDDDIVTVPRARNNSQVRDWSCGRASHGVRRESMSYLDKMCSRESADWSQINGRRKQFDLANDLNDLTDIAKGWIIRPYERADVLGCLREAAISAKDHLRRLGITRELSEFRSFSVLKQEAGSPAQWPHIDNMEKEVFIVACSKDVTTTLVYKGSYEAPIDSNDRTPTELANQPQKLARIVNAAYPPPANLLELLAPLVMKDPHAEQGGMHLTHADERPLNIGEFLCIQGPVIHAGPGGERTVLFFTTSSIYDPHMQWGAPIAALAFNSAKQLMRTIEWYNEYDPTAHMDEITPKGVEILNSGNDNDTKLKLLRQYVTENVNEDVPITESSDGTSSKEDESMDEYVPEEDSMS